MNTAITIFPTDKAPWPRRWEKLGARTLRLAPGSRGSTAVAVTAEVASSGMVPAQFRVALAFDAYRRDCEPLVREPMCAEFSTDGVEPSKVACELLVPKWEIARALAAHGLAALPWVGVQPRQDTSVEDQVGFARPVYIEAELQLWGMATAREPATRFAGPTLATLSLLSFSARELAGT